MGTVWVREFTGGLDSRRLPETAKGGTLLRAEDGHINRGGEFEQRAAFVKTHTLPAGATKGMAFTKTQLVVFGITTTPAGMPSTISYQRIVHPVTATLRISRIESWEYFNGKIYVVAQFEDGSLYHFYDGVRVENYDEKRARVSLTVVGGADGASVSDISINGVSIMGAAVEWAGGVDQTAEAIANEINSHLSSPDYTAVAFENRVAILAAAHGASYNGYAVSVTAPGMSVSLSAATLSGGSDGAGAVGTTTLQITGGSGSDQVTSVKVGGIEILGTPVTFNTNLTTTAGLIANQITAYVSSPEYTAEAAGGAKANTVLTMTGGSGGDTITSIKVNGVEILGATITFTTDIATTVAAIAAQINAYASTPNYTAVADGADITVTAADIGTHPNGWTVATTETGAVTWGAIAALAGGVDKAIVISTAVVGALWNGLKVTTAGAITFTPADSISGGVDITYQSGKFVRTGNQKMNALTESELHFSGVKDATGWISQNSTGSGFVDLSNEASNTEVLTSIAKYQKNHAVFSPRNVQIWYLDPDPANNVQVQVLNNTGTRSPRSVTQYGDNDLFYLDTSGVRSLRARDASNAAATTDIGVPIDTLVIEKMQSMTFDQLDDIIGLIEPLSGRFWLITREVVFVFSYFREANISAWSRYNPGFTIDQAEVFNRHVYLRSGDDIYVYGGLGARPVYDATRPYVWLPYLDADAPSEKKSLLGHDVACRGTWELEIAMDPVNLAASDKVATFKDSTFVGPNMSMAGQSTHFSPRLTCVQGVSETEPAVLSSVLLHFSGGAKDAA